MASTKHSPARRLRERKLSKQLPSPEEVKAAIANKNVLTETQDIEIPVSNKEEVQINNEKNRTG